MKAHIPLICLLFPFVLSTGCFGGALSMSDGDRAREEDEQMRHYRPVHMSHPDWVIAASGKVLTLHTGDTRVKLSVRQNPDRVVIREGGIIVGQIERTDEGAKYTVPNGDPTSFEIVCRSSNEVELKFGERRTAYTTDGMGNARSDKLDLKKTDGRRYYSISQKSTSGASVSACQGTAVESPLFAHRNAHISR